MDNITHSLTGLMLSRAGLNRWCPRATAITILAANAPDCDVVTWFGGTLAYLDYHRGITHSLAMVPVIALLPLALLWVIDRVFRRKARPPLNWTRGYVVSFMGVLTHPLLDWTNSYGTRLLLPFNETAFRLDCNFVIDAWIWGVLALAIAGPAISRLVSSEIGAKASSGRGFAIFALLFVAMFTYARYVLHGRAVAVLEARMHQGGNPTRVAAFPHPANPMKWTGLVEGESSTALHRIDLLREFNPGDGTLFYKPDDTSLVETASHTDTFRRFLRFAQFRIWIVTPAPEPEDASMVQVFDPRFGIPPEGGFAASALITREGSVLRTSARMGGSRETASPQ